jgi:hypothetical protein
MKTTILLNLVLSILFFTSCKNREPKLINVAEKITYSVGLEYTPGALPIIEDFDSNNFVENLISRIENQSTQAYKFSIKEKFPISFENVKLNFDAEDKTISINGVEQIVKSNIISQEIKDFIFIEDWIYDENNSTINKNVNGLAVVRTYKYQINDSLEEVRQNIPFSIYFNEIKNMIDEKSKLISPRVEYSVKLSECDSLYTSYIKLNSNIIIKTMIDNVINKKIDVYDYFNLEKTKLSVEQVEKNFGADEQIIEVENEKGEITKHKIKNDINLSEITELVFIEQWYYDEEKFAFNKKIIAYGPVREYLRNAESQTKVKTVPFLIYQ